MVLSAVQLNHDTIMLVENGLVLIKLNVLLSEYECNRQR